MLFWVLYQNMFLRNIIYVIATYYQVNLHISGTVFNKFF